MPTARESLLEAARVALERRPWTVVRMVEVAAAAGVSRQTLYNEFGDKAGLGVALTEYRIGAFLAGVEDALREGAHRSPEAALAAATDRLLGTARRDRVVRASLTGCRCDTLPVADREPGQLVAELRDRALRALAPRSGGRGEGHPTRHAGGAGPADGAGGADLGGLGGLGDRADLAERCETAIRLALSQLVAPAVTAPDPQRAPAHAAAPRVVTQPGAPEGPAAESGPPVDSGPPGASRAVRRSRSRVANSRRSE